MAAKGQAMDVRYRGYDLCYDTEGCDIYHDGKYVSTERDVVAARREIDAWLNAR